VLHQPPFFIFAKFLKAQPAMRHSSLRLMILALIFPLLSACASRGIPPTTASGEQPEARALLQKSAEAHGLAAWLQIRDLSVSYVGEWRSLVTRLQPTLIDPDFRQASEERLLLSPQPIYAQHHQGPKGSKQVVRTRPARSMFSTTARPAMIVTFKLRPPWSPTATGCS
jgi:hypothetical protein